MEKKKVLLIIPAYNEEKNIQDVYQCCQMHSALVDVLVINDGSTDDTSSILRENRIPHVDLICNLGIGGGVQTGYKYAWHNGYDIAIQFDGDGQHNIEYIDRLILPLTEGDADMVIGSRFMEKGISGFKSSLSRRMGIRVISALIKMCTGVKISDPTSGFRAVNRKVICKFASHYPTEYPEPDSIVDLLVSGFRIQEVPVIMNERINGRSSIHSWKSIYYMINVCLAIVLTSISRKGEKNDGKP